jgi:hypothetical protein
MKKIILPLAILISLVACNSDKKKSEEKNTDSVTSALSFIKSQVAQIDTSLFVIKKIEIRDSLPADTTDVHRNEFRSLAKDFLDLPDISLDKYKDQYTESKNFTPEINMVSLMTLPKEPSSAEIQKQELLITPDSEGGKMKTIIVDREWVNKDSSIIKKMIWQVDKYFQVVIITQMAGQPETTKTLKVVWNDFTKPE